MDRDRAKFVLRSFRPDGGDADEPAFAEALALATKDWELGEWLANERARDAAFASLLTEAEIPDDLREAIFEVLEGVEEKPAEFDADFVGALAAVRAPEGLREQILGAMEVEQQVHEFPGVTRGGWLRVALWTTTVAAVAAVVIGVGMFFAGAGGSVLAGTTPAELQDSAITLLEDPLLSFDLENDRQAVLAAWLEERNLPVPGTLPVGLRGVRVLGCKVLKVGEGESRGSMICYLKDEEKFHLVIVKRDALETDSMSGLRSAVTRCHSCPKNIGWAMTRWADRDHAYFLFGKMASERLAGLF